MRLLEVFKDFQIVVNGKSFFGRYTYPFRVEPKPDPEPLTLSELREYVRNMQRRYPDREFKLGTRTLNGKKYYIITRKKYQKDEEGKAHKVKDRIPIYFDLETQKAYVPESYLKTKPKLANYLCMVTLGALGLSQPRYARWEKPPLQPEGEGSTTHT